MTSLAKIAMILFLTACGSSVFKGAEKEDPGIDATLAIENNRPQDAIDILTEALAEDPNNYELISLLASAQAQLVGVDIIKVVLKLAEGSSEENSSSSSNEVTVLFGALPEATDNNISGLETALQTLETIPPALRTDADQYKLTIFYTARLGLRTKKFDLDGDGQVSPVELLDLSDADAIAIITSILSAQSAISNIGNESESTDSSSETINNIRSAIDSTEGETDAEKLRNYLGNS